VRRVDEVVARVSATLQEPVLDNLSNEAPLGCKDEAGAGFFLDAEEVKFPFQACRDHGAWLLPGGADVRRVPSA